MIYHVNAITGDDGARRFNAEDGRGVARVAPVPFTVDDRFIRFGRLPFCTGGLDARRTPVVPPMNDHPVARPRRPCRPLERAPRPRFAPRVAVVAGDRVDVVDHRLRPGCFLASVAVPRAMTSDPSMIVYMLMLLPPRM